jgi:hypothetical protein
MQNSGLDKYPYQPFKDPVPPIPSLNEGDICFTFDRKFLPYVLGALKSLEAYQTYDDPTPNSVIEGRNLVSKFIEQVDDCGQTCLDFPNSSSIIAYEPRNPFTEAGEIPDGYIAPPFMVIEAGTPAAILTGLKAGDVVSGWLSLPVTTPALGEGLARFRVSLSGMGTLELHLLAIPAGGVVVIVNDDDILTTTVVELNKDLVEIPPETQTVVIQERTFDTAGAHHVDVTFLPRFDDTELFVGYGGGLRKLVLCGFDDMELDVRQNPDESCLLEKRNGSGDWEPFADLTLCTADPVKASAPKAWRISGGKAQVSLDGGVTFYDFPDGDAAAYGQVDPVYESGVDKACVAAYSIVSVLRDQVAEWVHGLEIGNAFVVLIGTIVALALALGTGGIAAPVAMAFVSGLVSAGASGIAAMYTEEFYSLLECDIYETIGDDGIYSSLEFAALVTTMTAHSGIVWTITAQLFILIGVVGVNNAITIGGVVDCPQEPCEDRSLYTEMDFTVSPSPAHVSLATIAPENTADTARRFDRDTVGCKWEGGLGYVAIMNHTNFDGWTTLADIRINIGTALTIKKIEMDFYWTKDVSVNFGSVKVARIQIWKPDGTSPTVPAESGGTIANGEGTLTLNLISSIVVPAGSQIELRGTSETANTGAYHPAIGKFHIRKCRIFES